MPVLRIVRAAATALSPTSWRAAIAAREARAFDRRYGTDTVQRLPVAAMQAVPAALAVHAVQYEASTLPKLRQALAAVTRAVGDRLPAFAFLDVGSGKGLVVMQAARHRFREVVGVEMAGELHAIAQANAVRFAAAHPDAAPMRFLHGDAMSIPFPEGPLVVYLYNPFDATILAPFLARVEGLASSGREILVAYVNPVHRELLDRPERYQPLWDNGRVVVYRCRPAAGAPS
jgi:hypothetical protein